MLRVALGYSDQTTGRFAPAWPADEALEGQVRITSAELAVARESFLLGTPEDLISDDRVRLALAWMTFESESLAFEAGHPHAFVSSTD